MLNKRVKFFLRRWALARAQAIVTAADEWLHAKEVALREEIAGVSADGCTGASLTNRRKTTGARPRLSAVRMGPRRQSPRLKYQHGEFVRQP
jgi:hypothetical protein